MYHTRLSWFRQKENIIRANVNSRFMQRQLAEMIVGERFSVMEKLTAGARSDIIRDIRSEVGTVSQMHSWEKSPDEITTRYKKVITTFLIRYGIQTEQGFLPSFIDSSNDMTTTSFLLRMYMQLLL